MDKLRLFVVLMAVAGASDAAAPDLIDTAEVISTTPILERVTESRQECDPAPAAGPTAPAQQCRTVRIPREVVKGYTVVYRYNGRDITTTLPYDPGPTVRVAVGVVDAAGKPGSPTAGMLGTNVREVSRPAPSTAPAPATAPPPSKTPPPAKAPAGNEGGYQYRY